MATITKTIGASSDYATFAALVADAANAFSAGDDAIIELNEDAVFNEKFSFGSIYSAVAVNSIHLTSNSSVRHTGQPGTGARIGKSGNGSSITDSVVLFTPSCHCRISWLEVYATGNWNYLIRSTDNNDFDVDYEVDHNIVHGNGAPTSGNCFGIDIQRCANAYVDNNIVYDISSGATGGASATGIYIDTGGTPVYYCRNNTVDDITNPAGSGKSLGIDWNASNGELINNVVGAVSGNATASCFEANFSGDTITQRINGYFGTWQFGTNRNFGRQPVRGSVSTRLSNSRCSCKYLPKRYNGNWW